MSTNLPPAHSLTFGWRSVSRQFALLGPRRYHTYSTCRTLCAPVNCRSVHSSLSGCRDSKWGLLPFVPSKILLWTTPGQKVSLSGQSRRRVEKDHPPGNGKKTRFRTSYFSRRESFIRDSNLRTHSNRNYGSIHYGLRNIFNRNHNCTYFLDGSRRKSCTHYGSKTSNPYRTRCLDLSSVTTPTNWLVYRRGPPPSTSS